MWYLPKTTPGSDLLPEDQTVFLDNEWCHQVTFSSETVSCEEADAR